MLATPVVILATPISGSAATGDTVVSTGLNSDGQLGTGNTANRLSFGAVNVLNDVDEIAGGREHVLALVGGQVYSWGDGSKGATGRGGSSTADTTTPTLVPGLSNVTNVSTGHYHSLALLSNGTVRTWGFNGMGQLGDNSTTKRTSPVSVVGLPSAATNPVIDIVAGRDMSYALLQDGTVRAWGGGANGELGNGTTTAKQRTAVTVSGLTGITALAGGRNHGLALKSDGTVMAWGLGTSGRLGNGSTATRTTPVAVSGLTNVVAISAGADHSVALKSDGSVYTWGESSRGQLGLGTPLADKTTPQRVTGLPAIKFIGCGRDTTYAVSTTGQLWDWGFNDTGQLGNGNTTRQTRPIQVPGVTNAIEAHGGRGYTVVRRGP